MVDHNIKLSVPAVEKLLDMISSGVGAVAGPWLMRRGATAQSDSIRLIAQAQADAQKTYKAIGNAAAFKADMTVEETVKAGMQFQAEKQMGNVAAVVHEAKNLLGDTEVPDVQVDHDFSAHFFDGVKDVSSAQLRSIWAALLAGEIKFPGESSLRTLNVLKGLRQSELHIFNRIALYVIDDGEKAAIFNSFRQRAHLAGEQNRKELINYEEDLRLQESGLFMSGEGAIWRPDNNLWGECCGVMLAPLQKDSTDMEATDTEATDTEEKNKVGIPVVVLTQAGREIARCKAFLPDEADEDYLACIAGYCKLQGYELYAANILKRGKTLLEHSLEEWRFVSDQRK